MTRCSQPQSDDLTGALRGTHLPPASSPSYPHTCTQRQREELSSSFVRLAAAAAAAPAYTCNLGRVQGRHNSSHHSSTHAEFKNRTPCSQTHSRKCRQRHKQLSSHVTSSAIRKDKLFFLCNSCLIPHLRGDILTNGNLKC